MRSRIARLPMLSKGVRLRLAALGLLAVSFHSHAADSLDDRLHALDDLIAEHWEYGLKENPEFATLIGDHRYNDRWSDRSIAHVLESKRNSERFLARFQAIDATGLPEQPRLNRLLAIRQLENRLEAISFKTHEMPIDQYNGLHLLLPPLAAAVPVESIEHYQQYLARLRTLPRLIDQVIDVLAQGIEDGLLPPVFLLEKVVTQCRAISGPAGTRNVFAQPLERFPATIAEADRKRLRREIIRAIDESVRPAYEKLARFIATDYAPRARAQPGVWSLPDGDSRYRFAIRQMTTTELDPEAIHQLGLREVRRIHAEMTAIAKSQGFKDRQSFHAALVRNREWHGRSRQQLIDRYRGYIAQFEPKLPELFGRLPTTPLEILPTQSYREKEATGAEYEPGAPDGSRSGKIYVNTGTFRKRSLINIESTAYHEGLPGHHLQVSLAQSLPDLPPFRRHLAFPAYVEGWAFYVERLGKDVGFYRDPISDYGRLSDELLRVGRLALDTGVHYKRWTRAQMVDFFRENLTEDEPSIQAETDRYIAVPAQALAYSLGQRKILELRERAKSAMGNRFSIREFHDRVLESGAVPLEVLESRIDEWITRTRVKGQ